MFLVYFTVTAKKELDNTDSNDRDFIAAKIDKLATYPHVSFSIKKLAGFDDSLRIRVGNYRVFFEVDGQKKIILITKISDRKEAYR